MELFMTNVSFPRKVEGKIYDNGRIGKGIITDLNINLTPSGPPPINLKELEDRFLEIFSERRVYDIEEFMKFLESGKKQTNV